MPLVAVMKDGRVISSDGTLPPGQVVNQIRARLNADPESFGRGRGAAAVVCALCVEPAARSPTAAATAGVRRQSTAKPWAS